MCALLCGRPVLAADAAAVQRLEPVVVTGSRAETRVFDAPYAIGVIDAEALRAAGPRVDLSEALARVPGLAAYNRHNHAQDLQISSRGFGARAAFGVRGLRLYTDGIPATMPDGTGQATHFDLQGAERIEVLRGPFSALYGASSGGVIALVTRPPQRRQAVLGLDLGSHGSRQVHARLETPLANGWNVRAGLLGWQTDGLRPHSEARRTLAQWRLGWQGGRDTLTWHASALEQPADDPLGLDRSTYQRTPQGSLPEATRHDTRKTVRQQQLGLHWERRYDGTPLERTELTAYLGQRRVEQWQAIPPQPQLRPGHGGGVVGLSRRYHGLDLRAHWRWHGVQLVAGVARERQGDTRRGWQNFTGGADAPQLGMRGPLRRDEANVAASTDVYAQGRWPLGAAVVGTLGLRHGELRLSSSDRYLANGDDSGDRRFRYTQPVAGLQWLAAPRLSLYASAGRGFESPTLNELAYRSNGDAGFNQTLRPQRSRQLELGAKWRSTDAGTALDAAGFQADTDDEIGVLSNSGGRSVFGNVGRTRRRGLELGWQQRWSAHWKTQAAFTVLDAAYRSRPAAGAAGGSRRIAGTTPRSAFIDLAWQPAAGHELAIEWRGQGRMPVDDANSDFAAGHGLWALRAACSLQDSTGQGPQLQLRLDNLADRRHIGSVIVNEGNRRYFEPGAPRRWWLGLSWRL
ncbi:TonB-dependent receptor family protein [Eleftheria terrae]|uniref:TonB-dependent receptor family protein n=1 Tax=Eleftheria terrae TaxID=1597781 RepID=UPI00263AEFCA|nr:TonB-dependent receptor [Eleftheria terrae]WKB52191.1 TonB-dependent receptor [Eleftheria terrae]